MKTRDIRHKIIIDRASGQDVVFPYIIVKFSRDETVNGVSTSYLRTIWLEWWPYDKDCPGPDHIANYLAAKGEGFDQIEKPEQTLINWRSLDRFSVDNMTLYLASMLGHKQLLQFNLAKPGAGTRTVLLRFPHRGAVRDLASRMRD